jgi:cobalt-zinc-cadmium efflux system membrane fusion protein
MKRLAPMIVLAVMAGCNRAAPPAADAASSATARSEIVLSPAAQKDGQIETQPVKTSDEPAMLRVPGRIALADNRSWRVGVRTNGLVVAVSAEAGDYVRKGQILARYHADEVRDSRALYRAAQADVARAESGAALAGRNLTRFETLLDLKAASQVQVEQARQDLVVAQTAVRNAQLEVDRLKDLLEDDLRVPADPQPGDDTADQVPIIAPASGYILEKNVTLGKAIDTMDDTFVIGDLSEVWMLASIRQDHLGQLRMGQSVRVTVAGVAGQEFQGKIGNLGQELDPSTRTMQVRIALNNSGNVLRPGMLATAEVPGSERTMTVFVASDAVQQVDGQDVVFVRVAPDRFAVRAVEVAQTTNGQTPILQGLKGDEQVVVRGSFVLKSQLLRAALEES